MASTLSGASLSPDFPATVRFTISAHGAQNWQAGVFKQLLRRRFIRTLRYETQEINLTVMIEPDSVKFDLNFHTNVQNAIEARTSLEGKILEHRAIALRLLEQVYGLTTEES